MGLKAQLPSNPVAVFSQIFQGFLKFFSYKIHPNIDSKFKRNISTVVIKKLRGKFTDCHFLSLPHGPSCDQTPATKYSETQ